MPKRCLDCGSEDFRDVEGCYICKGCGKGKDDLVPKRPGRKRDGNKLKHVIRKNNIEKLKGQPLSYSCKALMHKGCTGFYYDKKSMPRTRNCDCLCHYKKEDDKR